jgi:hypothetical protein
MLTLAEAFSSMPLNSRQSSSRTDCNGTKCPFVIVAEFRFVEWNNDVPTS